MTSPSLILILVWTFILGAIFHLWRGGGAGKLLLFLVLSFVGFFTGQWIATYFYWTFDLYGQIHLLFGTAGSILFLLVGNFLSFQENGL